MLTFQSWHKCVFQRKTVFWKYRAYELQWRWSWINFSLKFSHTKKGRSTPLQGMNHWISPKFSSTKIYFLDLGNWTVVLQAWKKNVIIFIRVEWKLKYHSTNEIQERTHECFETATLLDLKCQHFLFLCLLFFSKNARL